MIPAMSDAFISGFCINVCFMSCGSIAEKSVPGYASQTATSPMTGAMMAGIKPYPVNSKTRLNEPTPLSSVEIA